MPNNASGRCSGERKGGTAVFPIGARANERLRGFTALTLACPALLRAAAAQREASVGIKGCSASSPPGRRALPFQRSIEGYGRAAGGSAVLSGCVPSKPMKRRGERSCPRC